MRLKKIIRERLISKTQDELAAELETDQQIISLMARADVDSTYEKHWQIFLRLLPTLSPQELKPDPAEVIINDERHSQQLEANAKTGKMQAKKAHIGTIPPRRFPKD